MPNLITMVALSVLMTTAPRWASAESRVCSVPIVKGSVAALAIDPAPLVKQMVHCQPGDILVIAASSPDVAMFADRFCDFAKQIILADVVLMCSYIGAPRDYRF